MRLSRVVFRCIREMVEDRKTGDDLSNNDIADDLE